MKEQDMIDTGIREAFRYLHEMDPSYIIMVGSLCIVALALYILLKIIEKMN